MFANIGQYGTETDRVRPDASQAWPKSSQTRQQAERLPLVGRRHVQPASSMGMYTRTKSLHISEHFRNTCSLLCASLDIPGLVCLFFRCYRSHMQGERANKRWRQGQLYGTQISKPVYELLRASALRSMAARWHGAGGGLAWGGRMSGRTGSG